MAAAQAGRQLSKRVPMQSRLFKKEHLHRCSELETRRWHLFDASGQVVGQMAARIAPLLLGKHMPGVIRGDLVGDTVVVVNSEKVVLTGKKWKQKLYRKHSGYPGGMKELTGVQVKERDPGRVLMQAVKGMLPNNKVRRHVLSRLKVYEGPDNPHIAQFKLDVRNKAVSDEIIIPRLPNLAHQKMLDYWRGMGDKGLRIGIDKDTKITFETDLEAEAAKTAADKKPDGQ